MTLAVVILAAGQGTRMQSKRQKILHEVGGKPMVAHVFEAALAVADRPPVIVVGAGEMEVEQLLGREAQYVEQAEQLGTGHAAMVARPLLQGRADQVLVTYGDMPLLRAETMRRLAEKQAESAAAVAMLSQLGETSSSFGRVVRGDDGRGPVVEIIEVAEAGRRPNAAELLAIREHNVGVYCFEAEWLWSSLPALPLRQARNRSEYYLTDMIALAVQQGRQVVAESSHDADESLGAGTRRELVRVEKAFRQRANNYWLGRGVTLIDPASTYIDQEVSVGQDSVIWPNTFLQGKTTVGEECVLGPNAIIRNAQIGDRCHVEQAVVEDTSLPADTRLPPFSYLSGSQDEAGAGRIVPGLTGKV